MKYPSILNLFKRDEKTKKLLFDQWSRPEFLSIKYWIIDEKMDGTNIRVHFRRPHTTDDTIWTSINIAGRTDDAQIPPHLLKHLQVTFTPEKLDAVFKDSDEVILYGEGYGPKIQSGSYYRDDVSFCLFDITVGPWWLQKEDVIKVAQELDIPFCASILHIRSDSYNRYVEWTVDEIIEYVKSCPDSLNAKEKHIMEGVVARSYPQMLFRDGTPIMFKLKCRDFKE